MRLPPTAPPSAQFVNAPGSTMERPFAIAARSNPDAIASMAETPSEMQDLQKEALARQYVFVIDRSGSMSVRDKNGTRWDSAKLAVEKMTETVFKYDVDHTIPLYLFDDKVELVGELTNPGQVADVFRDYKPRGTTALGKALREAMSTYAGSKRPNYSVVPGTTFIVLLDGGADDERDVEEALKYFANPANGFIENDTQIAVSFVQVGDDQRASEFLQKLDDSGKPDIVDFKKDDILWTPGGIDRLLHDAIFD